MRENNYCKLLNGFAMNIYLMRKHQIELFIKQAPFILRVFSKDE